MKTSTIWTIVIIVVIVIAGVFFFTQGNNSPVTDQSNVTAGTTNGNTSSGATNSGNTSGGNNGTNVPVSTNTVNDYTLHIGDTMTVAGVTAKVVSVAQDSRCPQGVNCIQAGTVKVNVALKGGTYNTTQAFELNKPINFVGYTVTLIAVNPPKVQAQVISPTDYVFTFEVKNS